MELRTDFSNKFSNFLFTESVLTGEKCRHFLRGVGKNLLPDQILDTSRRFSVGVGGGGGRNGREGEGEFFE